MKNSMFKKAMSVLLAVLVVVGASVIGFATSSKEKVSLDVQSLGQSVLTGKVYDDYSAEVKVPYGKQVSANEVTVNLSMTDVASLGITGTKSYSKTLKTGVDKVVNLDNYLPEFSSATINATIDGANCVYELDSHLESEYAIKATPVNVENARTAWAKLTSHVATSTQATDDSFISVPASAYIQMGDEKLVVEKDVKIDNLVEGNDIEATIRDAVKLDKVKELEDAQAEVYLPAGTVIALGQSVAKLVDAATIKVFGYNESTGVNDILSALKGCSTAEDFILTLVTFVGDVAGAIDKEIVNVNISFRKSVADVKLDKATASVKVGESIQLTATVLPNDAANKVVAWSSSDESIAKVDATGKVTGKSKGVVTITATAENGLKAECKVTVLPIEASSVKISEKEINISIGQTYLLEAIVAPSNADDKTVTWSSSDELVASVDKNGKVTAYKEGTAVITATTANGLKAECKVTVDIPYQGFFDLLVAALSAWFIGAASIVTAIVAVITGIISIIK